VYRGSLAETSSSDVTSFCDGSVRQNDGMDASSLRSDFSDTSDETDDDLMPADMLSDSPVSSLSYNVSGEELFIAADDDEIDHTQMTDDNGTTPSTIRKPFECFECHQLFMHASSLARHTLVHSGLRPYTCDICFKSFAQPGHVNIHKRTHTGEKPFVCGTCDKGFIDSTHLARHRRVHEDEKMYVCEVCSKSFRQLGTLNVHRRTHTGLKPFVCDICRKGFVDSTHLTIHKRNHSGERPYVCPTCDKAFMNTSHLNRHKRIHLDDRPPTCNVCGKTFTKRTSLTVHKRIHTRTELPKSATARSRYKSSTKCADTCPSSRLPVSPSRPINLSLHKRARNYSKSPNDVKFSTGACPVGQATGSTLQNQIQVAAESAAAAAMVRSAPPRLVLSPDMMAPFAGVLPAVRFPPMLDVTSALLRLPGLAKLAQMRHAAK